MEDGEYLTFQGDIPVDPLATSTFGMIANYEIAIIKAAFNLVCKLLHSIVLYGRLRP